MVKTASHLINEATLTYHTISAIKEILYPIDNILSIDIINNEISKILNNFKQNDIIPSESDSINIIKLLLASFNSQNLYLNQPQTFQYDQHIQSELTDQYSHNIDISKVFGLFKPIIVPIDILKSGTKIEQEWKGVIIRFNNKKNISCDIPITRCQTNGCQKKVFGKPLCSGCHKYNKPLLNNDKHIQNTFIEKYNRWFANCANMHKAVIHRSLLKISIPFSIICPCGEELTSSIKHNHKTRFSNKN